MGSDCPKQFLEICGKAILRVTIEKFVSADPSTKVIVVLPKDHISTWKSYCRDSNFFVGQTLVEGGMTRFHSVKNGLAKVPDGALVAIHDGVRPLLSTALINQLFELGEQYPAVIPVFPCVDTIKVLGEPDSSGIRHEKEGAKADRSELFCGQTPQIFQSEKIRAAYSLPFDMSFTDDAAVAGAYGIPLSYTKGEKFNLKITTPEDLLLAEAIMNIHE